MSSNFFAKNNGSKLDIYYLSHFQNPKTRVSDIVPDLSLNIHKQFCTKYTQSHTTKVIYKSKFNTSLFYALLRFNCYAKL